MNATMDRRLLAERIGYIRQPRALGVCALEAAAGRLIDRYPTAPTMRRCWWIG